MTIMSRRGFVSASVASAFVPATSWSRPLDDQSPENDNPFLSENFAPVQEEVAIDNLEVVGELPPDLNGMFIRNGPNLQFPPMQNYHVFEGDGMLHGVRIENGKASYRNRWVRTYAWNESKKAGETIYPSVLDPADAQLLLSKSLKGELPYPNTANTALVWHHGKLFALWEGGLPHEIRAPSLETIGPYNFGGQLSHAFTAHPKADPKTGELMFFGYSPVPPFLHYSVADRTGTIKCTTPIRLPRAVMMHDMAITKNYSVFLDCPAVIDVTAPFRGKPLFSFEPKYGSRIGVLPRHASGDKIRWFEIETCFVFHVFNAFEDGEQVVVYGCRFQTYPSLVAFDSQIGMRDFKKHVDAFWPVAYVWRLNTKTGETSESPLDDRTSEFPRVNEVLTGVKTRYGYGVSNTWDSGALFKYDFDRGTREKHDIGKDRFAGEGVFVSSPNASKEDDGWILSLTHDRTAAKSELRIVQAGDFSASPIAKIQMPRRVPYGFHAIWITGDVL